MPFFFLQDPAQADKLAKIQRDLDETKIILHKTIESVLDRGEKLDQVRKRDSRCHLLGYLIILLSFTNFKLHSLLQLVDKSADLSMASQLFYKQARKANSCCNFM